MICVDCNQDLRLCECPDIEHRLKTLIATGNTYARTRAVDGLLARLEYQRDQARERAVTLHRRLQVYRTAYRDRNCENMALQIQRTQARRYVMRILDGEDKARAIQDARAWLVRCFNGEANYRLMSRRANNIIPTVLNETEQETVGVIAMEAQTNVLKGA